MFAVFAVLSKFPQKNNRRGAMWRYPRIGKEQVFQQNVVALCGVAPRLQFSANAKKVVALCGVSKKCQDSIVLDVDDDDDDDDS